VKLGAELEKEAARLRQLLVELSRATQLLEKSEVGCCGISLSQCHLLLEVFRREGDGEASQSDLAAVLGLDLSTVQPGGGRPGPARPSEKGGQQPGPAEINLDLDGWRKGTGRKHQPEHEGIYAGNIKTDSAGKKQAVLESLGLLVEAIQKLLLSINIFPGRDLHACRQF